MAISIISTVAAFQVGMARDREQEALNEAEATAERERQERLRATTAEREAKAASEQARIEAATSKQLADFLLSLFQASDPVDKGWLRFPQDTDKNLPASELLDRAAQRIESEFKGPALTKATLLDAIGNVYRNLGLLDKAKLHLERAYEIRVKELPPEHLDISTSLVHLGQLKHFLSELDESALLLRKALAIREKLLGKDDLLVADVQFELAWVVHDMQSNEQAETLIREVLRVRKLRLGAKHPQVAAANALLALVLVNLGRHEEAVKISLANLDTSDMVLFTLAYQRAISYRKKKEFEESAKAYRELLAIIRRTFSEKHPLRALVLGDFAGMLRESGDLAASEDAVREGIALGDKSIPGHPFIIEMRREYAMLLLANDRYAEAETHFLDNYRHLSRDDPKQYESIKATLGWLVHLYEKWNKPDQVAKYRTELDAWIKQGKEKP